MRLPSIATVNPQLTGQPQAREYAVVLLRDGRPVWPESPVVMPARRRNWPVLGLAILLFVTVMVWVAWLHAQRAEPAMAWPPAPVVAVLGVTAAVPASSEAPGAVALAAAAPAEEESIEVCGLGRFTREQVEQDEHAFKGVHKDRLERGLAAALADMRQSNEPRTRAAALVMAALGAGADAATEPDPTARDALFQMASGSADPAVVQLALMVCRPGDLQRSRVCARPLLERALALEPHNAYGWMQLASLAQQQKDQPALAAALQGVVQATIVDSRFGVLAHETSRQLDVGTNPLVALNGAVQAIGIEAATGWPIRPVTQHCEASALDEGARRNDCERIAMLFTEHSRQLLDFSMGIAIGKRLGWSADRIERLEAQKEAMYRVQTLALRDADGVMVDPHDLTSCRGIQRQRAWVRDLAELGEIAALRQRIAASGYTEAELTAQAREAKRGRREGAASRPEPAADNVAGRGARPRSRAA